jgi:signal transduction histidine kinase
MAKNLLSFFILFTFAGSVFSQTPFIRNYTPEEYKGSTQNWSIVQDQWGVMYFGNNSGVIEFDGANWRTISTPGYVYSLCIDSSNCIYVGLSDDFGYLEADINRTLHYKSLKDKMPKELQELKTVWDIKVVGEKIILRTVNKYIVYQNDRFYELANTEKSKKHFIVRGKYYIPHMDKGLLCLEGDSLVRVPDVEQFSGIQPYMMLPYGDDEILIITSHKGVEIYNPKKSPCLRQPEEFDTVSKYLIKNKAYRGIKLPNGDFAISTLSGGILVFDENGKINQKYTKQNGLLANRVYNLFTDKNGQLWAALQSGISLIMNNLPFLNYTDKNGLDGSVYSIRKFKNKLYVGTSSNLYVQKKDSDFQAIEGSAGQNFFLHRANGSLLLGNHPNGIFNINDNQVSQSNTFTKSTPYLAIDLRKYPNHIITQLWNKGLALLEYKNEQWVFKNIIKGFDENARYIVENDDGSFWLSSDNHLFKLRLNETLDSVTFLQHYSSEQYHLSETVVNPYRLNSGEVIFFSKEGIYSYFSDKNYFEPHSEFTMFSKGVTYFKQDVNGNIWFDESNGDSSEKGVLHLNKGKYEMYKTPFLKFKENIIANSNALYPYSDSLVYMGTNKGLLEYHPKQKVNYEIPFTTLIREVFVNDSLFYGGAKKISASISDDPAILEYKKNNLFFHYSATFYEDSEKNLFSYRLIGSSDTTWSAWTNDHKKEYTNLHEGKYVFEVKSQNIYRKLGSKTSFTFKVLPPWYRSLWAYALYVILLSVFVWILIRLNSARLQYQNELLKQTVKERTAAILEQKDELQAQSEELQSQSEELQAQSEELQTTNEKLVEMNATKDKFFSIISHDLRSPFTVILGFADLLNDEYDSIDDTEKKEMINEMNKSSHHAYDMLANLLSWARAQRGQIKISKEQIDLRKWVEKSIAPYVINASKKEIEFVNNVPSDILFSIDKNTFLIFIGNLVNNAIKFTPEKGRIEIKYHENSDSIELHIIDTGVGIPPKAIPKLFRIDENVSTNGTRGEKGTGLGLILCKEFIEKNGGDISVKSEVGKGSEFIITLPK